MSHELISFDLDNTLWPVDKVIRNAELALQQWIKDKHAEVAPHYNRETINRVRNKLLEDNSGYASNLTALRKDLITNIFIEQGYNTSEAKRHADDGFEVFYAERNNIDFYPDAIEVLEALSRDFKLAALSNGNANLEKTGLAHLISIHHSAESIGRKKPAADMFLAAVKDARTTPERTIHVGDHAIEDIEAAKTVGMTTVWANHYDQEWPGDIEQADYEIRNLKDLLKIVSEM